MPDEKKFNFTKAAIANLPIPDKRVFYYDTKTRGLAVRVEPSGNKTFYLYRKAHGKPTMMKIGPFPDLSIEQARTMAQEWNVKIAKNEDPARIARRLKGEMSFAQLFAWYIEHHAKPRKKTWDQDEWRFKQYLTGLGTKKISQITKADLRKLHAELGEKHGIYTANKVLIMVQGIYNQAMYHDLFEGVNPAIGIRKFREQSRDRRLTSSEIPRFFQALREEPNEDLRDYVLMSLYTGARRGNVLAMRWDQIDFEARTWRIPETKNGLPQVVPLEEPELEILQWRKAKAQGPWVFPGNGASGHLVEPKRGWASLLKRAGIDDFRIHDLRRTLGSWMVDTGASLAVIGKALNHQSQETTAIYARLSLDPVREAKGRALDAIQKAAGQSDLISS
jgi:integrase